jgi:hypothetical protein
MNDDISGIHSNNVHLKRRNKQIDAAVKQWSKEGEMLGGFNFVCRNGKVMESLEKKFDKMKRKRETNKSWWEKDITNLSASDHLGSFSFAFCCFFLVTDSPNRWRNSVIFAISLSPTCLASPLLYVILTVLSTLKMSEVAFFPACFYDFLPPLFLIFIFSLRSQLCFRRWFSYVSMRFPISRMMIHKPQSVARRTSVFSLGAQRNLVIFTFSHVPAHFLAPRGLTRFSYIIHHPCTHEAPPFFHFFRVFSPFLSFSLFRSALLSVFWVGLIVLPLFGLA